MENVSLPPRVSSAGEYWVSMERQETGQTSTQELQTTHRRRSIVQVFSSLATQIASAGHFFIHSPHEMHIEPSNTTCPREISVIFAGREGYIRVAGREITLFIAVFAISKNATPHHLSMHPMHGSIERTITGTSASSQPWSILTRGGTLVRVGVLIRDRTRCLVPSPLT